MGIILAQFRPAWDLNIGQLAEVGVFLITILTLHLTNVRRLQKIETRLDMIYEWFRSTVLLRHKND